MYWRMGLSQLDLGLPLDAFQRPDRQVAVWMRNGDASSFHGVLEVDVASLLGDLFPSVGPQSRKNVPTVHDLPEIMRTNAHKIKGAYSVARCTGETCMQLHRELLN
jgi:hypothetical protein